MLEIAYYNEAKVQLKNIELDLALQIKEYFSYYADNYFWHPKYKAGIWDGKISMFDLRYCTVPFGLIRDLYDFLKERKIEFTLDKRIKRVNFDYINKEYLQNLITELKCTQSIRDYQLDAIVKVLQKNKCIHLLPTGSGKSYCYYLMIQCILKQNPESNILIIVPSIGLVDQLEYDFNDYDQHCHSLKDQIHKIYSGKEKITDKKITISTWQSLQNIKNKSWYTRYNTIFVDEVHTAVAKVLNTLMMDYCINANLRIGMSGSLHDSKINKIQLKACFGKIYESVKSKDLMENGYLTNIKINIIVLKYSKDDIAQVYRKSYHDEMKFLVKNKNRLSFIVKLMSKINNNSLIIFKHLDYGKLIFEILKKKYPERNIYYVAGNTPGPDREKIRLLMQNEKDAIVVASGPVFSTGVNIPSLKYLIFAQPYKSKIKVIQSIGRTLRKHENKDNAVLIDIVDDLRHGKKANYTYSHAVHRLEIYEKEQFKYSIKEVQL